MVILTSDLVLPLPCSALRRPQLQSWKVHEQLPGVPGGPVQQPGRLTRAPVRPRDPLALLSGTGGARQPVPNLQEDG